MSYATFLTLSQLGPAISLGTLILYVCNFCSSLKVREYTFLSNKTAGRIMGFYVMGILESE